MAVAVANPDKIIAGNVQIYWGEPDISEPLVGTTFAEGATSSIESVIANASFERGSGHSLFPTGGTPGALDGDTADVVISAGVANDGATNALTIASITWNPSAFTNLTITFAVTVTSGNEGAITEIDTGGVFVGKSMFFQYGGRTAEIPMTGSANGLDNSAEEDAIGYSIPNTSYWALARSVLDGLRPGDHYGFRIATSGGTQAVPSSNPGWSLLSDELYGEDGFSMSFQQTTELQRLLRDQLPVRGYRTAEEATITYPNLDMTVDTLAFLMNQRSVTTTAASADRVGYKTAELERGVDVEYNSLLVQFNSPDYLGGKAQFYLPRTFVSGNVDFDLMKTGSMAPIEFNILRSSTHDSAIRYSAQTAIRTS